MSGAQDELAIERTFDAPRDAVWRALTDHIAEWWAPRPWQAEVVEIEWRVGGRFAIAMGEPGGEKYPGDGVILDFVPGERLTFTNALGAGWLPREPQPVAIVGSFEFADAGDGRTAYRASARHWNAADLKKHAEMGFDEGWGQCADQFEEVARKLAATADA